MSPLHRQLNRRWLLTLACLLIALPFVVLLLRTQFVQSNILAPIRTKLGGPPLPPPAPHPTYKPKPTWTPPPVRDNFPLLSSGATPPPIPVWNMPKENLTAKYNLPIGPPLLIGFTRSWPMLLQAVVSYITAGWPPSQIYVVENTGAQQANARGRLDLQHQFYLNHSMLKDQLGVHVLQTPTLLTFAQLQNFYLATSHARNWPFYFWSHMDVLALSYEDGMEDVTPRYDQPGYKSLYELAAQEAGRTLTLAAGGERWATRYFAYDHLTLVNPEAYEDVGGWDSLIPFYITDCDMYSRLAMKGWPVSDARAGIVTDTATALDDLLALYRVPGVEIRFTDPNPPPPPPEDGEAGRKKNGWWFGLGGGEGWFGLGGAKPNADNPKGKAKRDMRSFRAPRVASAQIDSAARVAAYRPTTKRDGEPPADSAIEYWRSLLRTADSMFHYKHGERGRNTWQLGQHGGEGEPFYYDSAGFAEAIDVLTEAGREVFRRKWGHRDCDLISGAGLGIGDQWKVERDWKD